MAKKNTTNKPKDKVNEYLIDRIHELEYENRRLQENAKLNLERAKKYEKLKKCFYVENYAIFVKDFENAHVGCFAIKGSKQYDDCIAFFEFEEPEEDF